jgi:hypothetical protein
VSIIENEQMRADHKKRFRRFVQVTGVMACLYLVVVVSGLLLTKAVV